MSSATESLCSAAPSINLTTSYTGCPSRGGHHGHEWVLSFLFALYQPRAICAPTAKRLKGIFTVVFRVSHDLEMHSLIWATLRPCICLLTLCNLHFMSVQAGKKTKYSLQTCSRTSEAIENDMQALIIIYTSGEIHLGIWGIAVSENSMKSLRLL